MIEFPVKLEGLEGLDNVSGMVEQVLVANRKWFTTLAAPARSPGDGVVGVALPEELVEINTDHVFETGKGFIPIDLTMDTTSLADPGTEAADQNGGIVTWQGFYPGDASKAIGLFSILGNYNLIVLAKSANGVYHQLGNKDFGARFTRAFNTNTNTGERAGSLLTFRAFQVRPQIYKGAIVLHPTTP